jgi:hypothetical protein
MHDTDPQKLARIGGWLFIVTYVTSIPAALLYKPIWNFTSINHTHYDYILGAGHDTQIAFAAFLELLLAISGIGTAVAFYPVIKRQSRSLSLGYVASRTLESTVIVIGILSLLTVVTLRQDFSGSVGGDRASLLVTNHAFVVFHSWTFLFGPSFCAATGNGIILGTLMYRSGLVPRRLALLGVIGGPVAFLGATGTLFELWDQNSTPQSLLTVGEFFWELLLGLYLIVKGFTATGLESLGFRAMPAASATESAT